MELNSISGRVVLPHNIVHAEISIDPVTKSIVSISEVNAQKEDGALIFPGFIDLHVHAREYPRPESADSQSLERWAAVCKKETFLTAGRAAINGGVTLFAAMPNDPTSPDNPVTYARKIDVSKSSACPVILFGSMTKSSEPWADIPYKVYLDVDPSVVSFTKWSDLETALSRYEGHRVFFHAEDPEILNKLRGQGARWRTRPPEAEVSAVRKILELTAKLGLHTHVCHVSTQEAALAIQDYNLMSSGKVSCEVTPHHLFFSIQDGRVLSAQSGNVPRSEFLECNPPLRSEADRRFLLDALKEGTVDLLASDHAPHTADDKRQGAPGMPHLDTLGAFAGWLINECGFSVQRVAQVLSTAPAELLRKDLNRPHGVIEPSAMASFTLLDLSRTTLIQGDTIKDRGALETLCRWSPFDSIPLPARVQGTIVRGKQYLF
ncbi:MAG TPA: amidohydrolase family protein [Desulfomonilaceae bacterium]|nr:amidohydrolase family protein [Desulfomonilaceae bacterium]